MKILHKTIEVEPIKGIDRIVLNWYPDKGWLVGFSMGEDAFGVRTFLMTKNYTICGGFTAMSMVSKGEILPDDYITEHETEEDIINWLALHDIKWWKEKTKNIVTEHPMLTEIKNLNK